VRNGIRCYPREEVDEIGGKIVGKLLGGKWRGFAKGSQGRSRGRHKNHLPLTPWLLIRNYADSIRSPARQRGKTRPDAKSAGVLLLFIALAECRRAEPAAIRGQSEYPPQFSAPRLPSRKTPSTDPFAAKRGLIELPGFFPRKLPRSSRRGGGE